MHAKKTARKKIPKILIDRRVSGHADDIRKRDWSKNSLGQAFLKEPEKIKLSKFYSSTEGSTPGKYRNYKILEKKILGLVKARPIRPYGLTIYKGESGSYYVRLKSISSDKSVYIKVEKPKIAQAIDFLFR